MAKAKEVNTLTERVWTRLNVDDLKAAETVAEQEYDGNLGLLIRVAVKRLVASKTPEVTTTDTDLRAA